MIKFIIFAVLISACYAQSGFPVRATAFIHGVIMTPRAMQLMQQFQQMQSQQQQPQQDPSAMLQQAGMSFIMGKVDFVQPGFNEPTNVRINITFSNQNEPKALRGLHIHAFGISTISEDITEMCGSTGPHYNPTMTSHGSLRTQVRHAGDIGNVVSQNGRILTEVSVPGMNLVGKDSIVGRAVVLHEKADDEGMGMAATSKVNGDAGARIACGNIIYVN